MGKKRRGSQSPAKNRKKVGTTCRSRRRERSESPAPSETPSEAPSEMEIQTETQTVVPEASAPSQQNAVKPAHLTDEECTVAVEFMQGHPAIWDLAHEDYLKRDVKQDIWNEFHRLLPRYSLESLQKWWRNQRDAFRKNDKKDPSGPRAMGPRTLLNLQLFSFLRDSVTRNTKAKSTSGFADAPPEPVDRTPPTYRQITLPTRRASATVSRRPPTPPTEDQNLDRLESAPVLHRRSSATRRPDFSPADSVRSTHSTRNVTQNLPFGITRLDDNVQMQLMQQMQVASQAAERQIQREREDMRKEREEWREREVELTQRGEKLEEKFSNHYDLSNVPEDARHLLLQLGQVMGQLSPERRRNIDEQLVALLGDCMKVRAIEEKQPRKIPIKKETSED